jgi:1-acyl-sn-glycerol-3-phosphate acyltransferase
MVVFPEGTRFNPDLPEIIEKSRSYAKAQGDEN